MNEARTFAGHALFCQCDRCSEDDRLRQQRITNDAPANGLPHQVVSLRELVDNATHTTSPRYTIGEDWNDD